MKKIFSIAAAAAMIFGAASCQREDLLNGKDGDSKVVFNVEIPETAVTKAEMSDGSTVNELVWEVYVGDKRMYNGREKGSKQFVLELNLVTGQTYDLLFWAQTENNPYYDVDDLREINVKYDGPANDETRDAFYAARLGFQATGIATSETIKLYRPFAQINFGSAPNDWDKAQPFITKDENGNGGLRSKVTMKDVYTQFNVAKGDVVAASKADIKTLTYDLCPASETEYTNDYLLYKDANGNEIKYGWVAMNYVLAPKSEGAMSQVEASFVHNMNNENSALVKKVINVPFKQNYRTNILGEIFTGGNKFTVVIEPGFANTPIEDFPDYTLAEPVMFAFQNGGSVTLEEDTPIPGNIRTDKDVIINLNGKTLTYNAYNGEDESLIMARINKGGSLTINGPGKIESNGYIASANEGGKIIVNGDVDITAYTTAFQSNGGEIYLLGGTYKEINNEPTYLVNFIDAMRSVGTISIAGGTYHGFNPGNNLAEGQDTDFLAPGYESVETSKGSGVWTVKAKAADQVVLEADVKTAATINATSLVGNDKVIEADFSATESQYIVLAQQGGDIKNVTIKGSNKRNAIDKVQRGIFLDNITDDVTIEKVEITGVAYTINTNFKYDATKTLKLTVKDCPNLQGWTSPAGFNTVEFYNCNFTKGTYYNDATNADPSWNACFRAATTTTLKNCTFQKGFYISLATMIEDGTLTLENCKVDGVVLTADNIANYLNESEAGTLAKVEVVK